MVASLIDDWRNLSWNTEMVAMAGLLVVVSLAASVVGIIGFVILLPEDYFVNTDRRRFLATSHPLLRLAGLALKNLLGLFFLLLGLLLSVPGIPGQGLLTMLVGVMLLDFPGKYRLERRLVSSVRVLRAINALRRRFRKSAMVGPR